MNAKPSRCPPRTLLMLAMLGTALPLSLLATQPAFAQSTAVVRDYALPAGPLAATLNAIARGAGLTLAIDPTMVAGRNALPVQGRYTGEEAMRQALRDSGLQLVPGAQGQAYSLRVVAPVRGTREAVTLDPVNVSGRADPKEQIYETLGSVAVVTRADLDRIPSTTPRDMFTTQAGVYVMDGNQDPGLNINIRGIAGPGRNNVMIDGTRQNASSYAGYNGQTSRVYVDPELIGGITIEKGPTSGAGGAGVIGGVVNMRTLDADDLMAAGETRGGRARLIYGNKGYNTSGMVAGAIKLDSGLELVGGISRRDSDNYYAGKHGAPAAGYSHCMDVTTPIPNCTNELPLTYQDMTSALMKAKYRFGDGHKIELGTTYYENEYASWQRSIVLNDKYATPQLARNQTYTAKYSWTPSDNPWFDLRANVWKVNGTTENSTYFERYKLDTWGMELFNTSRLRSQWVNVDLTYGGEYHADDANTEIMQGGTSGLGLPGANPDRVGMTGSGKRNLRSAFATARFMHSSWLQVEAGVRHDSYGLQGSGSYVSPYVGQANTPFTVDRSAGRVNPRLAIAIAPVEGVQGYASYTEGYRPPSLAEAAAAGTVFGVPNVPNPLIKSEVAKNTELGLNFARDNLFGATNKLRAKVARFQNNYDNFISRAQIPYQQSNLVAYTYFNLDKVTFRGTELQFSFDAGYAFIDMNFTEYDKMLFCNDGVCSEDIGTMANNGQPYVPPRRSLNGSVGVRLIDRKLVLGARVRKDNKRGTTEANQFSAGNAWVPYEIYDLFGSFAVNKKMTVGFSVENITDKYYIGALSVSGVPSSGRNFKASLTYAF